MGTRLFHAVVLAGAAFGAASLAACGGADQDDLWAEPAGSASPELTAVAASDVDAAAPSDPVRPNVTEPVRNPTLADPAAWPPTKM
jgi:hypothetical protein